MPPSDTTAAEQHETHRRLAQLIRPTIPAFKPPPPTDLLSRLQAFLPQIAESNLQLKTSSIAGGVEIEPVQESDAEQEEITLLSGKHGLDASAKLLIQDLYHSTSKFNATDEDENSTSGDSSSDEGSTCDDSEESIDECELELKRKEAYIEMSLGLGVFEMEGNTLEADLQDIPVIERCLSEPPLDLMDQRLKQKQVVSIPTTLL